MAAGNIESVLSEERRFDPNESFADRAQLDEELLAELCLKGNEDPVNMWAELARELLTWHRPFTAILDRSQAPHFAWFSDGELNASEACLGPWIRNAPDRPAIVYEGEEGDSRTLTYRELGTAVERLGTALRGQGVASGDRVVIYMPMCPEPSCHARLRTQGAVHTVVFAGSGRSLYDRCGPRRSHHSGDVGGRRGKSTCLKVP